MSANNRSNNKHDNKSMMRNHQTITTNNHNNHTTTNNHQNGKIAVKEDNMEEENEMSMAKIFTVSLMKRENGGLGFLIRQRRELPYLSVCEIIKNGAAEANGEIRKGDLILKVNHLDLAQVNYERGLDLLKSIKPGNMVELTLLRPPPSNQNHQLIWIENSSKQAHNPNALMSPLMKFKRKFISCAGNQITGNLSSQSSLPYGATADKENEDVVRFNHTEFVAASAVDEQTATDLTPSKCDIAVETMMMLSSNSTAATAKTPEVTRKLINNNNNDEITYKTVSRNIEQQTRVLPTSKNVQTSPIGSFKITTFGEKIVTNSCPYQLPNGFGVGNNGVESSESSQNQANDECMENGACHNKHMTLKTSQNYSRPKPSQNQQQNTNMNNVDDKSMTIEREDSNQLLVMSNDLDKNSRPLRCVTASSSTSTENHTIEQQHQQQQQKQLNQDQDDDQTTMGGGSVHNLNLSQLTMNNSSPTRSTLPVSKCPIYSNVLRSTVTQTSIKSLANSPTSSEMAVAHKSSQSRQQAETTVTAAKKTPTNMLNTIKIIQEGDDIRICIDDGNIEIVTNRNNDRKVISLSPQCERRKPPVLASNSSHVTDSFERTSNRLPSPIPISRDREASFSTSSNNDDNKIIKIEPSQKFISRPQELPINHKNDENNSTTARHQEALQKEKFTIREMVNKLQTKKECSNFVAVSAAANNNENDKGPKITKEVSQETNGTGSTATASVEINENESVSSYSMSQRDQSMEIVTTTNNNKQAKKPSPSEEMAKKQDETASTKSATTNNLEASPRKRAAQKKEATKMKFLLDGSTTVDVLHNKSKHKIGCTADRCMGSMLEMCRTRKRETRTKEEIINEAVDFINQFYASVKREGSKTHKERVDEVIASINKTGTYELKETELCFGARTGWRNAPRCIGRIQWSRLQVFDARYVTTARGMFEAICNHLKYATNKGNIRSAITIFRQRTEPGHDFRVWNPQLVNYAGYKIDDHTWIGDQANIELTEVCIKLGWKPKYVEFELLPLVLQANGQDPEWFELPPDLVMELPLVHPKYDWFRELNMKWYCVPAVASMMLDVGGLEFTACPFNGWYMGTEIGRDLADVNRFNKLTIIAEKMGLEIKSNSSLWKDKALVELNYAILHTFQKSNATIIDHHTAAESFMKHYENENKLRGGCPGDWVWVVPPLSSHLTPVFHLEMLNYVLKPSYEYQDPPWRSHIWKMKTNTEDKPKRLRKRVYFSDIARAVKFSAKLMGKALARRVKCTILYATETGRSERFAKTLAEVFKHAFDAKVLCMKDYDVVDLEHETLLLVVTSTFGNGDPPENGEELKKILSQMRKDKALLSSNDDHMSNGLNNNSQSIYNNSGALTNVRFAVFGLGNSSYPKFCSFGKFLDSCFSELGAERIYEFGTGDELCGQEDSFRRWCANAFKSAVDAFCIDTDKEFIESLSRDQQEHSWSVQTVRLTPVDNSTSSSSNLCETLSKLHGRKILPSRLVNRSNLQKENSGRVTLKCELNTHGSSSELQYKPGDHVGVLASNRIDLVDAVLAKVTNAPPHDQLVKLELLKEKTTAFGVSTQWIVDERIPPFTLRTAFTYLLDITSPLSQNLLMYLSTQATAENDRIQLEKLAKDHILYEEWKLSGWPNLVEILDEFSSVRPNASLLITQLPKLQPRFYSISSSPKVTDDIHITVGVVSYKPYGKPIHYGVCSKWLQEIDLGAEVPTFVRGAPSFRMPEDPTCPIIMVGAGTGIAPFRSFWQERKIDMEMNPVPTGVNGKCWGEMILYFGCRHKGVDELYRTEIDALMKDGVITKLFTAYSRDSGPKKYYVQDALAKNSADLYDVIVNHNCHFYVCGDVRMAAEVTQTLETALHKHSKMTLDEAKIYVNEMKENLRFHEDIFGNSVGLTNSEIN